MISAWLCSSFVPNRRRESNDSKSEGLGNPGDSESGARIGPQVDNRNESGTRVAAPRPSPARPGRPQVGFPARPAPGTLSHAELPGPGRSSPACRTRGRGADQPRQRCTIQHPPERRRPGTAARAALHGGTGSGYAPTFATFHARLVAAGKRPKVALVACMHKLLLILNAIIRTNQPWHDEQSPVSI